MSGKTKNSKRVLSMLMVLIMAISAFPLAMLAADAAHEHTYFTRVIQPTCTQQGYTYHVCACGANFSDNTVAALGHDMKRTAVVAPTCTAAGYVVETCANCGYSEITNTDAATGHTDPVWVTTKQPTCTKDGEQVGFCSTCGKAIETKTIAATGHGATVFKIDYDATDDHDGQKTPYCSVCGEAVGESQPITKHGHDASNTVTLLAPTCETAGEKGIMCSICDAVYQTEEIAALGHTETVSVIRTPATCTESGEKVSYCKRCSLIVDVEEIEATGHVVGAWYTSTEPTCTTEGTEICTCGVCGVAYDSRKIDALGHDDGVWQITVPATCTEDGESCLICTRCNVVIDEKTIPSLGHTEGVSVVRTPATCTTDGEMGCYCDRCGLLISVQPIPATGHDNGVWKLEYDATPDHEGRMNKYCTKCDQILDTETFTLHTHQEEGGYRQTVIPAGCMTEGEGGIFCGICGAQFDSYTIEALGHDYSEWYKNNNGTHSRTCSRCHDLQTENCHYTVTVKKPTCTKGGYTTHTCDVCGFTYVDKFTAPLGHDWGNWTECSCDSDYHYRTCKRCGEKERDIHEWSDWTYNHDACLFRAGTKTRVCTLCGAVRTEKAHHTSWICRIFYPIGLFICNFFNKVVYAVSLNWLFPWLTIPYQI